MVSIIALNIAKQGMIKGYGDVDISWISASDILKSLELQGMLPPFTYLKELDTLDTAWEPEDE